MVSARKLVPQTYEDYLALGEGVKAELIDGEILMSPQPKGRHIHAASFLLAALLSRFGSSKGPTDQGPGGWWIYAEPEVHLRPDRRVFVPDLAGWRRERMPRPPTDTHKFTVIPDWVCEIVSPSTQSRDLLYKMPRYLEAGVAWAWLVYPADRRIDVMQQDGDTWSQVTFAEGPVRARLPPFDAVELDCAPLWPEDAEAQ